MDLITIRDLGTIC